MESNKLLQPKPNDTESCTNVKDNQSPKKKKKEFKCQVCSKVFGKNQHLTRHIKIHTRTYKCSKCDQEFEKWSLLQKHMKLHKYECFTCSKQFISQKTLSMHLKIHFDTQKFTCSGCGKEFNRKQNMIVHYRTVHLGLKPFECLCGTSFGHKHLLSRHIRTFGEGHGKVITDTTDIDINDPEPEEGKDTEQISNQSVNMLDTETNEQVDRLDTETNEQVDMITEANDTETNEHTNMNATTSSILKDLGLEHSRFSLERPIACYVDGCQYRFKRVYDLQRHVFSFHNTLSEGIDIDMSNEELIV